MSKYWSDIVSKLDPYVPGEQPKSTGTLIKLNTNENPYGPSPAALAAMQATLDDRLRLYPDPNAVDLKAAVADYYQLNSNQVFVGNGSDEVLAHVFLGLLKQSKPLLFPDITYSFYPVYCGLYEIDFEQIALNERFEINPVDYQRDNGAIIFPNPNAPTGIGLALESIRQILDANPESVVVVDEAYIDFGGTSAACLINEYPNLLVVQTLSKSRALAGLRVGFAMGHADLIDGLERVKNSFNSYPLDRLAIAGAVAAMNDQPYFEQSCSKVIASRDKLTEALQALGFDVLPSQANFIFAKPDSLSAERVYQLLREQNIIVRYFNKPRISDYLRITIGTDAECEALIKALKTIIPA